MNRNELIDLEKNNTDNGELGNMLSNECGNSEILKSIQNGDFKNVVNLAESKVCGVPDGEFRPCLRNTSLKCCDCDQLISKPEG